MQFVTDFGDQAVILPWAIIAALALFASGWRRGALAWCLVVPATLGVLLFAKLATLACGHYLPPWKLHSPSGHTASAAVVYGGLIAMLAPHRLRRIAAWVAPAAVAALIGVTRVHLHEHSAAEAIVGGLVGCIGAWVLSHAAGPRPRLAS
ncbi:MAG TPA: phosphatase PAP2 family protein, partial [Acetobacteraceae bacterium]